MKKLKESRLGNASKYFLCCDSSGVGNVEMLNTKKGKCFSCLRSSVDDAESNLSDVGGGEGKKLKGKKNKPGDASEKLVDAVCLLRESPFRILRVAESGNVKEFNRLITADPSKLNIRDGRERGPVHQATVRNHVAILQVIVTFNGNLNLTDSVGNTPLHLAVESDALNALDFLLANGADASILNERQQSPLHLAVELNKTNGLSVMAKYRKVINVNVGGEHGRTALHTAAMNDYEDCMKILLYDMGVCPKIPCKNGFFPIHEAAKHASSGSMEILLTWGETNGCSREEMISFFDAEGNVPLHSAVHGGDIKAVELCIKSGARISIQQHDLSTPVHLACSQGSMEIVKLMFTLQPEEKEVCLRSCDLQRMTPLHCAAMFDHCELVEYLVSQGTSVNALDKERRSPLHLAAFRNGWKTMKALMRLGASINIKDNDNRNVLHAIVIHGGELEKFLDDETCVHFIPTLEERDKNGYTPLHYAAKHGHIKTAAKLLKLGASVASKNNDGENVFHLACRYGRVNIISLILKTEINNSIINEGNGKGLTPLHIASTEGHLRVVQILLKKGAILHRDHDGRTPLHLAAQNGHMDTMKLILNVHSHLLDQTDKDGNTPLHVASQEDQPGAVDYLLTANCSLTYNHKGFSAIDFALQNKFAGVALVMVTHPTRGDEVLGMTTGKYPSVMLGLIATMPHVVTAVLDTCITKSETKSDSEYFHLKYDFKWLALAEVKEKVEDPHGHGHPESASSHHRETDESYTSSIERKHLPILNGMVSYGRVELLSHELSLKYLQMKWDAYGKYINLSQLILYCLYLAILTSFAASIVVHDNQMVDNLDEAIQHQRRMRMFNLRGNETITSSPRTSTASKETTMMHQINALGILFVALLNLFHEAGKVYRQSFKYALDTGNWIFWAMNFACVVMVAQSYSLSEANSSNANTSAAIAVFLGWFYLLLFLQRFDVVGIYVVMFLEILHTLLRVLMVFSILIVAFGLAFYILLSAGHHIAFAGIPSSLMRTFSMMLGDMDYINTFVNPYNCGSGNEEAEEEPSPVMSSFSSSSLVNDTMTMHTTTCCGETRNLCTDRRRLPYPYASFAILAVFMVFMPILLMNLLIGLAVGDIESVRRNAQLKRLAMQVQLHTALEKTLPKFILHRVDRKEVIEYPNEARKSRLGLVDYLFKYFQPKSRRDTEVTATGMGESDSSDDVLMAVQESNLALQSMSNHLENIETLMRLLCHKMELCTDADYIDEGTQVEDGNLMSDIRSRFKRGITVRLTKKPPPPKRSESSTI